MQVKRYQSRPVAYKSQSSVHLAMRQIHYDRAVLSNFMTVGDWIDRLSKVILSSSSELTSAELRSINFEFFFHSCCYQIVSHQGEQPLKRGFALIVDNMHQGSSISGDARYLNSVLQTLKFQVRIGRQTPVTVEVIVVL